MHAEILPARMRLLARVRVLETFIKCVATVFCCPADDQLNNAERWTVQRGGQKVVCYNQYNCFLIHSPQFTLYFSIFCYICPKLLLPIFSLHTSILSLISSPTIFFFHNLLTAPIISLLVILILLLFSSRPFPFHYNPLIYTSSPLFLFVYHFMLVSLSLHFLQIPSPSPSLLLFFSDTIHCFLSYI